MMAKGTQSQSPQSTSPMIKSVHITDAMMIGLIRLAIQENWGQEEVEKRVKQFSVATALNDGKVVTGDRMLTIAREVRAKHRRKTMRVVD